ncbi:unnamed protein product [Owenia fusiformis]|uniref:Uncharacterized protein n=1 Tax=Owenia fusiformis TaxID=6347 RepID=A0A8J1XTU2_OWEFU|nr:unnamed protein product [Owenia fusiformis]
MYRLAFRRFLLDQVDFEIFPPYGSHIKGIPQTAFEGFLQSIDTHMQLYALIGPYNQRAVSSLVNENFFGELSEVEPTKLGCPKATHIGRLMSTVTEVLHYRHNPSCRSFAMSTSRRPVYPQQKLDGVSTEGECKPSTYVNDGPYVTTDQLSNDTLLEARRDDSIINEHMAGQINNAMDLNQACERAADGRLVICTIPISDHFFDTKERARRKQRKFKQDDIAKPREQTRKARGVRQFHSVDESKILPTTRLGIKLKD